MGTNNYLDKTNFSNLIIQYNKTKQEAIKNNLPIPQVPEEIGQCFLDLARGISRRYNFSAYTFKEDMISDGIENCLSCLDNFNPAIPSNSGAYSYFTKIIIYAFLRRIESESKQTYIKFKSFENHDLFTDHKYESKKHVDLLSSIINEKTIDIIEKFETRMRERKAKKPIPVSKSKTINLNNLMQ